MVFGSFKFKDFFTIKILNKQASKEREFCSAENIMMDSNYREMLEIEAPFYPADKDLDALAESMAVDSKKIPAGYTYLSQFITHDISFESKNRTSPWALIDPASISNMRNPVLNLETLYGIGVPSDQNNMPPAFLMETNARLKLGNTYFDKNFSKMKESFPNDLPRTPNSSTALLVDLRNDENLAIAQTHTAFIKFHNAVAAVLGGADTTQLFEETRRIVIQHYQFIILHDYLPRVVKMSVLNDVLKNGNKFYRPAPDATFLPLEFSVAAFRLGHSMVANSYQWNRIFNDDTGSVNATLDRLKTFTGDGKMQGRKNLPSDWIINWNWFYNINNSMSKQRNRFNFAMKIDTSTASQLGFMNPLTIDFKRENSLAAFDLYRGRALGLPTGQAAANKIAVQIPVRILAPQQIENLLPEDLKKVFSTHTPLWFYLLAEAEINEKGQTLGDVGSRIVAETVVELLKRSPFSILENEISPAEFLGTKDGKFGMAEMLGFIAKNNKVFDELNPVAEKRVKQAVG